MKKAGERDARVRYAASAQRQSNERGRGAACLLCCLALLLIFAWARVGSYARRGAPSRPSVQAASSPPPRRCVADTNPFQFFAFFHVLGATIGTEETRGTGRSGGRGSGVLPCWAGDELDWLPWWSPVSVGEPRARQGLGPCDLDPTGGSIVGGIEYAPEKISWLPTPSCLTRL